MFAMQQGGVYHAARKESINVLETKKENES